MFDTAGLKCSFHYTPPFSDGSLFSGIKFRGTYMSGDFSPFRPFPEIAGKSKINKYKCKFSIRSGVVKSKSYKNSSGKLFLSCPVFTSSEVSDSYSAYNANPGE
jgi:hypothetical protein